MATKTRTSQLNVLVDEAVDRKLEKLGKRFGWSKREAASQAIFALDALMGAHERFAAAQDADIGDLYMKLAAEMPAELAEVPKDGVRVGRAADRPAVMIDKAWLVFPDEAGGLLAEEQGGQRRVARVAGGEIKPIRLPSAEVVALN